MQTMRVRAIGLGLLAMLGAALGGAPGAAQGPQLQPAFATGALPPDPGYYNLIPVSAATLPEGNGAVDLSRFMPPPQSQGSQGSCAGWAVAYAARSFAAGIERAPGWSLTSAAGQFSPAFVYNEMKAREPQPCHVRPGLLLSSALQFVQAVGVVPLSAFPYDERNCSLRPSASLLSQAASWRIRDFASLGNFGEVPLEKVLEQLDAGRPVILGIYLDKNFRAYTGGVLTSYSGSSDEYHAIVAVGYDRAAGTIKLQNSWGPGWGEGGTVRIAFGAARQMIREAFVILDAAANYRAAPGPEPVPVPTPSPTPLPVPRPSPSPSDLAQRYFDWFDAVEAGDQSAVRKGLEAGLRPDIEVGRETGLELAIDQGNVGIVRSMLAYRPRLNTYVRVVGNYLSLAINADRNNVAMVRLLLEAGIDPNILDRKGYSELCTLSGTDEVFPGSREIFKMLKSAGGRCIAPEVQFK